ncbi:hypothetical protein KPZU09_11140 [Klebsiella pneumoniae]|uniref:Uncharacterized protein n=1 Tax=Klebsiella pneumoniae TaxID=573 RepID=A0A919HMS9_KLEPN|nr:hypothetical protein KPZU09_11140 [Klebsiella pneumoniae]
MMTCPASARSKPSRIRAGGFPGAGFAHQRMGAAASDFKADAVERLQRLFAQREAFADPSTRMAGVASGR